jgi:hypothetical protein
VTRVVRANGEGSREKDGRRERCESVTHDDLLLETGVPKRLKRREKGRVDAVS